LIVAGLLLAIVGWLGLRRLDARRGIPPVWQGEEEPALSGLPR
jgi:hypothetical protein